MLTAPPLLPSLYQDEGRLGTERQDSGDVHSLTVTSNPEGYVVLDFERVVRSSPGWGTLARHYSLVTTSLTATAPPMHSIYAGASVFHLV